MFRLNLLKYSASKLFQSIRSQRPLYFMETLHHSQYNITTNIDLTPTEKDIFNIFTTFVQEKQLNTTVRVAGGWVRDKCLGRESSDIDFAIDNMMGEEFVKLAYEYLKEKTNVRGFGVTRFNPEKSKHLETAKIEVMGVWIDIVNLRGETYTENSRVPQIVIGTPEQDAYRRDLTINSLFYNIHNGQIEDFTNKGLEDLKNGIARTPLPADQTFIDDPLRILRAIRFVSRFDLKIDQEMADSFLKNEIREGLLKKVSKERVGVELKQMLSSTTAFTSVKHFHDFGLFPYMIEIPVACVELGQNVDQIVPLFEQSYKLCQVLKHINIEDGFPFTEILKTHLKADELRFMIYLAAIMSPFAGMKVIVNPKTQKTDLLVNVLMKESLKLTNNEASIVTSATSNKEEFRRLLKELIDGKDVRLFTAKIIKDLKQLGNNWEVAFVMAFIADLAENINEDKKVAELYEGYYKYIHEHQIANLFSLKSYLDGGQIQQLFPGVKGPSISIIKDNVFYWQVENPGKSVEELQAYIGEHKDEFMKERFPSA